jgi:hypothetical protein
MHVEIRWKVKPEENVRRNKLIRWNLTQLSGKTIEGMQQINRQRGIGSRRTEAEQGN